MISRRSADDLRSLQVALAGKRPHLVEADDDAALGRAGVELLDCPLLRVNSGSARAPNQVSFWRHFSPSASRTSPTRLRFMPMPCFPRWATKRSSVQDANGKPNSDGRDSAAITVPCRPHCPLQRQGASSVAET